MLQRLGGSLRAASAPSEAPRCRQNVARGKPVAAKKGIQGVFVRRRVRVSIAAERDLRKGRQWTMLRNSG